MRALSEIKHRIFIPIALMALVLVVVAGCSSGPKPTIKLADNQFESIWINNAIAKFIITEGYGYPVETIETTTPIAQASINNGEMDVWMEMWQQNFIDNYNEMIASGNLINLGPTYEGGPQFFIVPASFAKEHNLKSIEDMKKPEVVKALANPENPSKGAFVNCPIGWQCAEINRAKIYAYGLDKYYDIIGPGSGGALEASLAGGALKGNPVFGYYWAPTALMGTYEWTILEEPKYTADCWKEVAKAQGDKNYVAKEACAYEILPVDKGINKGLQTSAPDVVEMLKKLNVGVKPINDTAAWAKANKITKDWEKAALYYFGKYESTWTTWMPADKATAVKEAIAAKQAK